MSIFDSAQTCPDDFVMIDRHGETETIHAESPVNSAKSPYLRIISKFVDALSGGLRELSLDIHDHPELKFKEFHAHKVLTAYLAKQEGWLVTPSAYGIDTAFVAVFDSGRKGPVVAYNAEYDALKGIGHACGHNLIAVASLAGALATARTIAEHKLPGKVVLFGTPAEEGGGGKIKLLKAGAYEDYKVDVCLISHPGIVRDTALVRTSAYSSFKVEYFGREAHAAAAPWEGINALDALITAYNAISVLRQQTQPGDIIQGHITNGGLRPNIIHAYAAGAFVVRSDTKARLATLKKRVFSCFDAGACASGATLKVTPTGSYDDHSPNKTLGACFRTAFNELGGSIPDENIDYIEGKISASTDQGNVSYAMPSISPGFWIRSEDHDGNQLGGPHTPDFERAARTEEAHGLALRVGKALSSAAVDVLTRPELLKEIKHEFDEMKKHP